MASHRGNRKPHDHDSSDFNGPLQVVKKLLHPLPQKQPTSDKNERGQEK